MRSIGQRRIATAVSAATPGVRALRLFAILGFALTLAACDKCSMPVWRHDTATAPQSCHDDAPAQQ
jgi:hypothetical protein